MTSHLVISEVIWPAQAYRAHTKSVVNYMLLYFLVDRSENSTRIDGISHKIGNHKHQFRRKDLGGCNLLSRKY